METSIIELVMGLALIFATLALLLMKLQESTFGNLMRRRVANLHTLVLEALQQDAEFAGKLFANPLIFALSEGEPARPGGFVWAIVPFRRPTGPSAIPPTVFARALLMELNNGTHPEHAFATPQTFLDKQRANPVGPKRAALLKALDGLAAGRQADWPGFEAAIATWFEHIGDRSDGWYKRSSDRISFRFALVLCAVLNVDTLYMVNALSADPTLRVGLANLAEDVSRLRESERGASGAFATDGATAAPARPAVRATTRLVDANAALREAFQRDADIARFGHDLQLLRDYCTVVPEIRRYPDSSASRREFRAAAALSRRFASNADAWVEVIPALVPVIELAVNGIEGPTLPTLPSVAGAASAASAAAPAASGPVDRRKVLGDAYQCLTQVSAWVRAASTASALPEVRKLMLEAAGALEESKSALLALRQPESQAATRLRDLFLTRPADLEQCAREAQGQRERLLECMRRDEALLTRLPLGWIPANVHRQFCQVEYVDRVAEASQRGTPSAWICPDRQVAGDPRLGMSAMRIVAKEGQPFAFWVFGVWVSAMFVALGAPFWFDLLGRLVKLRNSGRVRDGADDAAKGRGMQPLPSLPAASASRAAGNAPAGSLAGVGGIIATVKGGRNTFEDQLLPREILALQAVLGVDQTGEFDAATRDALGNRLAEAGLVGGNTLNLASYTALVRRPPEQATEDLGFSGTRPTRGQPNPQLRQLRQRLAVALDIRRDVSDTVFNDDLRALAVLYRVKTQRAAQPTPAWNTLAVVRQARDNPTALDEIDEALVQQILALPETGVRFSRDAAAAWMDWAWGELGQVEKNASSPAASNPRICDYLAKVGLGGSGDATPWCAAFVTWVLERYHETDVDRPSQPLPASDRAAARSWRTWQRQGTGDGPAPSYGDVVVVQTNPAETDPVRQQFHVGFYVGADGERFWMLGGNQAEGGRVCLSCWPAADIRRI